MHSKSALTFDAAVSIRYLFLLLLLSSMQFNMLILATDTISTIAGNGATTFSGDGGQATAATLYYPYSIGVDTSGNVYIADTPNYRIRKLTVSTGIISSFAGNGATMTTVYGDVVGYFNNDNIDATSATLTDTFGIAFDSTESNLYFCDSGNHRVRKISLSTNIITTVAGNGATTDDVQNSQIEGAFSGDGGDATSASLYGPIDIAFDLSGNLYIADADNNRVRKVTSGTISTIVGSSLAGYSGDGGDATSAKLVFPHGVAVDNDGIYFNYSSIFRMTI